MPVKYVCRHCGYVLWEFNKVGQDYFGLPSPSEVINAHGGICPRCKHDLRRPSLKDIKISIARKREPSILETIINQRIMGTAQENIIPVSDRLPTLV